MRTASRTISGKSRRRETTWPVTHWLIVMAVSWTFSARVGVVEAKPAIEKTDRAITQAIEIELQIDPAVSAHLIDVSTTNAVATLSGSVDNLLTKDRSVLIAQTVKGVRAVIDRLKVNPVSRSDEAIQSDITAAWLNDPATDAYEITNQIRNGAVNLTGLVQSWQEKQLAAAVAKGVKGVIAVTNRITWKRPEFRPDFEIQNDIERRLRSNVWVDEELIKVEVNEGEVRLSGAVGSALEKSRAYIDAWVSGARSVNDRELEVDAWVRNANHRPAPVITDEEIKQAIRTAFQYDPRVNPFNVEINFRNGPVVLRGVVDNMKAKWAAYDDAQNTVGVNRVDNFIKVRLQSIGHHMAVANLFGINFSGFLAWWLWRAVYLSKLPSRDRKVRVMLDWTLDLFFARDINHLSPRFSKPVKEIVLQQGGVLFEKDEPAFSFYVVKRGCIEIQGADGRRQRFGEGSHFGEEALLNGGAWDCQARAVKPTKLVTIPAAVFKPFIHDAGALEQWLKASAAEDCPRKREENHVQEIAG